MLERVQLYRTCDIPQDKLELLLSVLNNSPDSPQPNHFGLAPLDEANGLAPIEVWGLHWQSLHRRDAKVTGDPVVILDERTAQDNTILLLSSPPAGYDNGTGVDGNVPLSLRLIPEKVPIAAANLQIGNQTLDTYMSSKDDDGIWRNFTSRSA
ncbi:hypothetical protein BJ170DRAFT_732742 [Xylariales sp. AK1849]|nr:hypothetical protein BJ170DRAFT_732742 [Xylariales sp. AK1849]